ncbi:SPOR domain-containing protein [Cytophagaceae bacterium ABcell3]|nr:SPOR domain-containing protein [Cytophagaceae bacterium ABcell3]
MVEKYLQELLFEHDCVVVPEFGGFLARPIGAEIHPVTHKFFPPSKKIAFNEQLKLDDGVLISAITAGEGISRADALNAIQKHVEKVFQEIEASGQYVFKDIGKVFKNVEGNLEFEPQGNINYEEDSFGLSELYIKPVNKDITPIHRNPEHAKPVIINRPAIKKENTPMPEKKEKKGLKALALMVPVLVLIGAGITFFAQKDDALLSGLFAGNNSAEEFESEGVEESLDSAIEVEEKGHEVEPLLEEVETEEEPLVSEELPEASEEEEAEEVSAPEIHTVKYYLVAGAFSNQANAVKLFEKYTSKGVDTKLIEPAKGNGLYKVTVAEFESGKAAFAEMETYKKQFGNDLWILKY